jgi:hypothetical protein
MGWKSTKTISRDEAISAIMADMSSMYKKTNEELEDIMCGIFGDDVDKPYHGHNFIVEDEVGENED